MNAILAFIKRYPFASYCGLLLLISWGGLLLLLGRGLFASNATDVAELLPLVLLVNFAGPPIAGIVMTTLVHGKAGLRDLRDRLTNWRVGARWYAIALLTAPILVLAILLALDLTAFRYPLGILTTPDKASLLAIGIGWGLLGGGLLEELGWTGFAVPILRQRHDALTTGIAVGLLWGLWHLPITYWVMHGNSAGTLSFAGFTAMFVFFHFGALPAYRVLLVWLHDRTRSLPATMLMHAMYSASRVIFNPVALAGVALVLYDGLSAAALWLLVAIAAAAMRSQRYPARRRRAST